MEDFDGDREAARPAEGGEAEAGLSRVHADIELFANAGERGVDVIEAGAVFGVEEAIDVS